MADDEVLAAGRGVAVEGFIDLTVGGVDAHLKHLHQHSPPVGNLANVGMRLIGQLGNRNVPGMNAILLARQNGNGFHREGTDQ